LVIGICFNLAYIKTGFTGCQKINFDVSKTHTFYFRAEYGDKTVQKLNLRIDTIISDLVTISNIFICVALKTVGFRVVYPCGEIHQACHSYARFTNLTFLIKNSAREKTLTAW
jgi:hypothetical protein